MEKPKDTFHLNLTHQSREDEAINGTSGVISYTGKHVRYPLILFLDGIVSALYMKCNLGQRDIGHG